MLTPYRAHLPNFQMVWELPNLEYELIHLYGDKRWTTISNHTKYMEKLLSMDPTYLPTSLSGI